MLFTIAKCRIIVSFPFIAVIVFLLLIDRTAIAGLGLVATVVHEFGHIVSMYLLSVPPAEIKCNPFGIDIIEHNGSRRSYRQDIWIALAGPSANLIACALFFVLHCATEGPYSAAFSIANGALAVFNLLPIEPLDGGQALYSALCFKHSSAVSAKAVEIISFLILFPLAVVGFLILLQSRYNFSLLLVSCYLMLLLLMKRGRYF